MKWLCLVILLCHLTAACQTSARQPLQFQYFGLEDGLSQSNPYCVLQDKNGFLWIGTQDGLNKYDGYRFTVYRNYGKTPATLSSKWIYALAEDKENILWIGTGKGLNRLNTHSLSVETFLHSPTDKNTISSNDIKALLVDHQGLVWIGTSNAGISVLDYRRKKVKRHSYTFGNSQGISGNSVQCIYEDQQGNVWIGTTKGLSCFDRRKKIFIHYGKNSVDANSLSGNNITAILQDKDGVLWFGTDNDGLTRFDPTHKKFTRIENKPGGENSLSNKRINGMVEDNRGVLWLATGDGLVLFDRKRGLFSEYNVVPGDAKSLRGNNVTSIAKGQEGLIWIGNRGLLRYNAQATPFSHYRKNSMDKNSLSHNQVWPITEDENGLLWIGTLGGGLNSFDRTNNKWTHYLHHDKNPASLLHNDVWHLFAGRNQKLWINTGAGLDCMNLQTKQLKHYPYNAANKEGLSAKPLVSQVIEDRKGNIWAGTVDGLNMLNPSSGKFSHFKHDPTDKKTISGNSISCVKEAKEGGLWVGTFYNGLNYFDPVKKIAKRYQHDPADSTTVGNTSIYCLLETAGKLWIGGDMGVDCLDLLTGKATHLREKDGLPNETIMAIVEDKKERLWFSSNQGIFSYHPAQKEFHYFNTADGLQSMEFNGYSSWYSQRTGEIYFGGVNGFNVFHPDSIRKNSHKPAVFIHRLKRFNTDTTGTLSESNLMDKQSLILPYNENLFSLEFLSLSLSNPHRNKYCYKLEGLRDQWIQLGTTREVTFAGLPPGEYTLLVKGSNGSGIWNEKPTALSITITSPWYRTWWFYSLLAVATAFVLYTFFRFRMQQKMRLLQLRNRLHRDLHDDLGATMSSIKVSAEMLGKKDTDPIIKELIRQNAADMIDRLEVISWATNPQHDNVKSLVSVMLRFARPVLSATGTELVFETKNVHDETVLPGDIRQNVFMVFKETINNVIKYAEASRCTVCLQLKNHQLVLEITDNGKGYNGVVKGGGAGMKNMHKRAEEMGGTLDVQTILDKGTAIKLSVPYPFKLPRTSYKQMKKIQ